MHEAESRETLEDLVEKLYLFGDRDLLVAPASLSGGVTFWRLP